MEWVETTGRTVADAVDAALDQLGVDEQEADVQVLDQPQKGLFGRLRVEARVRARVRPKPPREKFDRRERRRRAGRRDGSSSSRDRRKQENASRREATGTAGSGGGRSDDVRANSGRDRSRGGRQQEDDVPENVERSLDLAAQRSAVEEFVRGLTAAFERQDAVVSAQTSDDATIVVEVEGEGLGLLVGPRGQTLQAIHELARRVIQRQFADQSHARLQLDIGGYRQRRREALERFGRGLVDEVLSSGRAKVLDPMSPADRKIIHDVVNATDGVRTRSEGDEPERRVIVEPADAGSP